MMDTIQLLSDATEADIIKALADLPGGGTIILPENKTIAIRSGLDIDVAHRDITLDLNGSTLRKAGDVPVILGRGEHDDAVAVKLGTDPSGNTVITYPRPPADLAVGAWVKVVADDKLPGDHVEGNHTSRIGQAMEVLSVQGNAVTFKGALIDQASYDSNVRAALYSSGELVVRNGEIVGDQKHPWWKLPLVQLRSVVDAQVENLTVRDGIGRGINVVDSIDAEIADVTVKNLLDGGAAALGIAVSSLSSTGTTVKGLYAENVTHAADDNAVGTAPNAVNITPYGGDIGMNVSDSVAVGARNFAWSWHSESVNGTFDNVMAFDSHGFLMARGIGGEMTNSGGAGNGRGILFYEYGDKDGRNITVDGVTLRETLNYSVFAAQNPLNNIVSNSVMEAYGPGNLASIKHVLVKATEFVRASLNPNDALTGTAGNDMLLGGKGADEISGGAGDDYVWGGAGKDSLTGGYGRDRFAFHSQREGADVVSDFHDGSGGDILDLSVFAAKYGWDSGDPIANGYLRFVQTGADVRVQTDSNGGGNNFTTLVTLENIQSSQLVAANVRLSLSSAVVAQAPAVADPETTLRGTEGADVLRGGVGSDHIIGGGGADKLFAFIGATLLEGGTGNDGMVGNLGSDVLKGGADHDWMWGGNGEDKLYGAAGNDALLGGGGNDSLYAGEGNDVLDGGLGADMLAGSGGYDTTSYASSAIAVTADIASAGSNTGGAAGDRYSSIENLAGSAFDDVLRGNRIANVLEGGAGNDTLLGRLGADTLLGGTGADWLDGGAWKDLLTGGSGADSFYFANIAQAGDTVSDFQSGVDHFVLSGKGFGIDPLEGFSFVEGLEATSADATILCDRDSGQLLWDADGTGAHNAVRLVSFAVPWNFSETDILIG